MKSEVILKGNKKDGWIIEVSDNHGYKGDLPLTQKEIIRLKELLNKKIK